MGYTKQKILNIAETEDVEFIRLQFTDLFGTLKNVAITKSQLAKALDNKIMFDGSSIEGFARIEESDMYLYPDYDTFEILPFRPHQGKVARLICDVYKPDGKQLENDPRYILKKVIKEAASMGYTFNVGPECEFFLFHTDDNGNPTTISHEHGSYFDLGPTDLGENARRDMVLNLEEMGFEVEASHHEVAPAQHEIDFKYGEALKTADRIMTYKLTVKTIAKRHGLYASFMPKPKYGMCGSGMHINMSLFNKEGQNIFVDENDKNGLEKFLKRLKKETQEQQKCKVENRHENGIGAVVMNCNPFTRGHEYLIREAAKKNKWLHIFILSEEQSFLTTRERYQLVKEGIQEIPNVILHQTSEYMISPAVFPTYFIKEKAKAYEMNCQLDIQLFGERIAPELNITDRYVGSEPACDVTHTYNQCLREQLPCYQIRFHEIPRKTLPHPYKLKDFNVVKPAAVKK